MKVKVVRPKKSKLERIVTPLLQEGDYDEDNDRSITDTEMVLFDAFLKESKLR